MVIFVFLVPKKAEYLYQVLSNTFCLLRQHSNPLHTAAGVCPNCWLEKKKMFGPDRRQLLADKVPVGSVAA